MVNELTVSWFTKTYLLGHSSTRMMPGKQDVADSCPIAVHTQKPEGKGDLRDPRAPSLNQEVDENQTESGQQGEDHLVLRAREKMEENSHWLRNVPSTQMMRKGFGIFTMKFMYF